MKDCFTNCEWVIQNYIYIYYIKGILSVNSRSAVARAGKHGNLLSCRVATARYPGDELNSLQLLLDQVPHKIYGCCNVAGVRAGRIFDAIVFSFFASTHNPHLERFCVSLLQLFMCSNQSLGVHLRLFNLRISLRIACLFFFWDFIATEFFSSHACSFVGWMSLNLQRFSLVDWFVWNRVIWQLLVSLYFVFCLSHRLFVPSGSRSGVDTY